VAEVSLLLVLYSTAISENGYGDWRELMKSCLILNPYVEWNYCFKGLLLILNPYVEFGAES
jgi:hypothetical protein